MLKLINISPFIANEFGNKTRSRQMVECSVERLLSSPCQIIDTLFEHNPDISVKDVQKRFQNSLCDDLKKIPWWKCDDDSSEDGKLFRFRGIVQQVFDPQFVMPKIKSFDSNGNHKLHCGLFREVIDVGASTIIMDENLQKTDKISSLVSITIVPCAFETEWIRNIYPNPSEIINVESSSEMSQKAKESILTIKIYNLSHESIRLNQIIEGYGILYKRSIVSSSEESPFCDELGPHLPHSKFFIHCIHHQFYDYFKLASPIHPSSFTYNQSDLKNIRSHIIHVFSQMFAGDTLVGEYLLYSLISRVRDHSDQYMVGSFPVNVIIRKSFPFCRELQESFLKILSLLIESILSVPATLDFLNKSRFHPSIDSNTGNLCPGVLQIVPGTVIIVDETVLSAGKLIEEGIKNLNAMNLLISRQEIEVSYQFYSLKYPVNQPVIVFSYQTSILKGLNSLYLNPSIRTDFNFSIADDELQRMRSYLHLIRCSDFNITDSSRENIETDYVRMREESSEMNPDRFQNLLTLLRLVSQSYGLSEPNQTMWDHAKSLESQRHARFPKNIKQ